MDISEVKMENKIKDNYSRLTFTHCKQCYLVKCIYAPNKDSIPDDDMNKSTSFFRGILNDDNDKDFDHFISVGEFNVAPNHDNGTSGYLPVNNPNTRRMLNRHITLNNWTDIWHEHNPDKREFTFDKWKMKNRTKARLDIFLITNNSTEYVTGVQIGRACKLSDHRPIHLQMSCSTFKRGRVFWRYDNNLLKNIEFIEGCNKIIASTMRSYSSSVNHIDNPSADQCAAAEFGISYTLLHDVDHRWRCKLHISIQAVFHI